MSVHYKFKSALSFDTITFDGLHISVRDLKKAILQQKQIGKATDFDLQITNAQSNEVYDDENVLIPKNSSLIVVRVPLTAQQKKNWEKSDTLPSLNTKQVISSEAQDPVVNRLAKTVDLANVDASEGDKIQAAITQSTLDYDPSNYLRIKGSNQVGELPANYRCYKCLQPGHWIKDCKLNAQQDAIEIKKSTGIPRSFMVPVEGPEVPGAMMTPTGQFAVPSIEHEARREPIRKPIEPAVLEKPTIPDDLLCGVCKDLLNDAVLIPCCGNSFCDECIRNVLLESEDHQCPDCREKDVSPDTLIPNRFLRNSVNNFKNQTGYMRALPVKQAAAPVQPVPLHQPPLVPVHQSTLIPVHIVDEVPPAKRSPPPLTPASPDNKEEPTVSPDEIVIVNEVETEPAAPASPMGNAIPALQTDSVYPPPQRHPLHHIPSRPPPNPNICPKGEDKPHHLMKDKSGGYMNKRADRSGTPTVDERNNDRYQSINVHVSQPGMTQPMHHVNQAPHNNQHNSTRGPYPIHQRGGGGNYMYARPHYVNRGGRAPMPYSYPPGGGPPHMRGAPPYRGRPRAPYNRTHSPNNTTIPAGPIDDPVEIFERLMIEKDLRRAQRQSHSRSPYSRSRSRSPRSPRRLPSRSRSRSRTRTSTRTRSHSRSPVRRRRTRSRSQFSLSRSSSRSIRSRSQVSRSPSRDRRDYSPRRRPEYRSPIRQTSSPTRYYSQRYKEELQYNSIHSNRNGRGRYVPKPAEYYTSDYPRYLCKQIFILFYLIYSYLSLESSLYLRKEHLFYSIVWRKVVSSVIYFSFPSKRLYIF
uniref:Retinoblastoma-binding protein n=1 Tax=Riptortus pedestris TaxID=329032 RepID=R4WKG4_RIPPE|nr:hypothetical protein [Riptortus pedestris]